MEQTLLVHYYRCMNKFVCLFIDKQAHVAQLVERILGKDEVGSSNLPISTSSQVYFLLILDLPIIFFWLRGQFGPPKSVPRGTTHV